MGLSFVVAEQYRLPMLNSIRIPEGADDKAVRAKLLNEFGIEIGGGLGAMAGKVCVAEVEEVVEVGAMDPDHIHLPGIYVDRIVVNAHPEKRIENRTVSAATNTGGAR